MTRLTAVILAVGILLAALLFGVTQCQSRQTARTETAVAKGQSGAAIESGADAVSIAGNRAAVDAAGDIITQENRDAIQNADGANAPVAAPVRDAGIASLCRRTAYSRDPRCLQPVAPR